MKEESSDLTRITVKSQTLFDAKNKAFESFENTLIHSIAKHENASSDTGKIKIITKFVQEYDWSVIKGPAYQNKQGIHDTLLLDKYWEKEKLSRGGYLFTYYSLFDCTTDEIKKIANQYNRKYNYTGEQLESINQKITQTNSIDTLVNCRKRLFELEYKSGLHYLEEIEEHKKRLDRIIESIRVQVLEQTSSVLVFEVLMNGEKTIMSPTLKIGSNCAKIENYTVEKHSCTVVYNSKYCLTQDRSNSISIHLNTTKNPIITRNIPLIE